MIKKSLVFTMLAVVGLFWGSGLLQAQQQAPDTILYNGKIVTVNNHEVNANLGAIAQALAIREGKVLAVGTDADLRRLAGANTKSIDLKGRTVTPGFIVTHDHPQDWNSLNEKIIRKVIPSDDVHVERFLSVSPEEVLKQFPRVFDEAVQKATPTPGKWIRISLLYGKDFNYEWRNGINALIGRQINKQMLDLAAPNNPVQIRLGFTGSLFNQKAIDMTDAVYGAAMKNFLPEASREFYGYRYVEPAVVYTPAQLIEIYRLGLSWYTGYGQTLNGTALYSPMQIRAYRTLDRRKQLAMRFSWSWFWSFRNDFFEDPYFVEALVALEGLGSDYFWLDGMDPEHGGNCSKLTPISPEAEARKARACTNTQYSRQSVSRALYEYVKAGGRMSGNHMMGDDEIDLMLDTIEKASKDAGMTPDEIRAKRHISNHMTMYPRTDQIPRYKSMGMMTSGFDFALYDGMVRENTRDYGERGAVQSLPRKAMFEAGVMNNLENDRPIEYTDLTFFDIFYTALTRKDQNGTAYAPATAIDRQSMMKVATIFGAYAAKKESVLGSLEPGKWADLTVMDKDYLTVSIEELRKIHILMTMVGGKIEHMAPSAAREWGMQPVGAQVELGGLASQW
ncbi:MAG: hypothetical protein A3F68_02420 [Acidobacteria bacterium RIFCSPLOWO2_12_FULL_54_10]|nr:MAG: hypothetical protein A3F68_02420 [Acidobacteria bacterium RIFCSPLOWO2_12_FULL_54_10]